jgi:hypothetical protein
MAEARATIAISVKIDRKARCLRSGFVEQATIHPGVWVLQAAVISSARGSTDSV